jgi:hypothetical protein
MGNEENVENKTEIKELDFNEILEALKAINSFLIKLRKILLQLPSNLKPS